MTLSRTFKISAAALAVGGAGCGSYFAADHAYRYMAAAPLPALSAEQRDAAQAYNLRFTRIVTEQNALDATTDDEDAGLALLESKRALATDAVLDRTLSEADLARLARDFNAISDDGVRFRSYNYAPQTVARRNECLRITSPSAAPHGDDRYAYAQRVETCMITMTDNSAATNAIAARMGGMGGGGMAFAFLLGYAARRRVHGKKPATPAAG